MFNTSSLSRKGKYFYRGAPLTFSHKDKHKYGVTNFIFKTEKGQLKTISRVICQQELWEEISF